VRHLNLRVWQVEIRAGPARLHRPTPGVVVEAIPFARPGAHLTRDFDDLLAWLATRMDKTSIARLRREVSEVCQIFCATANPVQVILTEAGEGRAILGVVDRGSPLGVETDDDEVARKALLRAIGYKL
jgi:Adenosine specific kinase/Helix-turn-helix domain of transposase family ISL3